MGKIYEKLEPKVIDFLAKQKLFFVSTAPLSQDGLINCSPKGWDCLRILDDLTVAYIDLTGSGVETISHLKENQRITFLFCAFEGPPRLVRLYGKGEACEKGTPEFDTLKTLFPDYLSARAIIKVKLHRISDSCGYTVPFYEYKGERDTMEKWVANKGAEKLVAYREEKNKVSLDGLPGLK